MLSSIKLYAMVAGIVALLVGGISIFLVIHYLNNKVEKLEAQNVGLQASNTALTETLKAMQIQKQQIEIELNDARLVDTKNETQLRETEQRLNIIKPRIENIDKKRPQTYISIINKNVECQRLHFSESGKCVNGVFKSD